MAVQCSADTFVVNQSLVLRINIFGANRHLRQARKRYGQVEKTVRQIYKAIISKKKVAYVTKRWRLIATILKRIPRPIYDKM